MDTIGFIGAGNMAFAIAGGIQNPVCLYDHFPAAYEKFQGSRFTVCDSVSALAEQSDLLVLSVKPQNFTDILPELSAALEGKKRLIVSIAAGVTLKRLEAALPGQKIVRVMPNTPLLVGVGAAVLCRGQLVDDEAFAKARQLFASGGVTVEIDESIMNAAVAIHGSSPAIFFEMADAAAEYGVSAGLTRKDALRLFCQTMMGSAKMLMTDSRSPKELSKAVCSPGGTTLAMLDVLKQDDWFKKMIDSFDACTARADELAENA